MKRALLLLCVVVLACTLSFVVFAADDNTATSEYVITIPDSVEFDANGTGSFTIELFESLSSKQCTVTVTGNSYNSGYWHLTHTKDNSIKLRYTISDSTTYYGNNDAILDVSNPGVFEYTYQIECIDTPTTAGNYTDVITLNIDVQSLIPVNGQAYAYGDYIYTYSEQTAGWNVTLNESVVTRTKTEYGEILDNVQGFPVVDMTETFQNCTKMTGIPEIPSTVTNLTNAFSGCTSLTGTVTIDVTPTAYTSAFSGVNFKTQNLKLNGTSNILDDVGLTGTNYCTECNGKCDYPAIDGAYYVGVRATEVGNYHGATAIYLPGEALPAPQQRDVYRYGEYEYRYEMQSTGLSSWATYDWLGGWGVRAIASQKSSYGPLLETINGKPLRCMNYTFAYNQFLTVSPEIPSTVRWMKSTYYNNIRLTTAPALPESVRGIESIFESCSALTDLSNWVIPGNVQYMTMAFYKCTSLKYAPVIPSSVTSAQMVFYGCTSLTGTVEIHANLTSAMVKGNYWFKNVNFATQNITLTGTATCLDELGSSGSNYCAECNGTCQGAH